MKRRVLGLLFWTFCVQLVFAEVGKVPGEELSLYEYQLIHSQKEAVGYLLEGRSLFLFYPAYTHVRHVEVAFEHEGFKQRRSFHRNMHGIFFLKITAPRGIKRIRYRLAVNNIWEQDPLNIYTQKDALGNVLSVISLSDDGATWNLKSPVVRPGGYLDFYYVGSPGQRVHVAGSFNNWDPFNDVLEEDPMHPGLYKKTVRVAQGDLYYYYVVNGHRQLDYLNLNRRRTDFVRDLGEAARYNTSHVFIE